MAYTTDAGRVATGVARGPLDALRRTVGAAVQAVRRYNERVRAEAYLNSLSDHNLADIGLTRGQIRKEVWGR